MAHGQEGPARPPGPEGAPLLDANAKSILLERQERSGQEEGPDRGSDAGDCAVDLEDCMEFVEGGLYPVTEESLCTVSGLCSGNEDESCVQNSMMI